MKNKYLVINKNGKIYEPKRYLKQKQCSYEMAICIKREVLGEKWEAENASEYIKFANKLGFNWEENSKIGFLNYNYKADLIKRLVEGYARNLVMDLNFPVYEVKGSNFFDLKHPVVEAYAELFGNRLFQSNNMVMSYDASYPQFNLAAKLNIQERDLPFAHFSISDCYRYEQSGECMILFRGRRFFMPDIHPYFKNAKEAWLWYPKLENKLKESFKFAGKEYINIANVSSKENWKKYKEEIVKIAIRNKKEILVDIKGDKEEKYWIVDIDYGIIDKFEQFREIACIQIDLGNAKRLNIKYSSKDGEVMYPAIIHSAIPGGIERYIYMLIDNYESFPIDFQPIQLRIIPVGEKFLKDALELLKKHNDIRIDIDDKAESVSKRIKRAHEEKIPNILIFGEKERGNVKNIDIFKKIKKQVSKNVPFIPMGWPVCLSKRVG